MVNVGAPGRLRAPSLRCFTTAARAAPVVLCAALRKTWRSRFGTYGLESRSRIGQGRSIRVAGCAVAAGLAPGSDWVQCKLSLTITGGA